MPPPSSNDILRQAADLHRQGRLDEARRLYAQVLAREPDHVEALHLAGAAAAQQGKPAEGIRLLTRAARLDPRNAVVQLNLALTLSAAGQADAALRAIEAALAPGPVEPIALRVRGDLLQAAGRLESALQSYARAAELTPQEAGVRILCGNVLAMLDRMEEALAAYDAALARDPGNALAHKQRGVVLNVLQRHMEALESLDRALERAPDWPDARYTRAIVLLTLGDYERGFREHEWRWRSGVTTSSVERRSFAQPEWDGAESLAGRRILLYSEQGLGDTLQFCRYARWVADRGATVILQVQRPLLGLLREVDGVSEVVSDDAPTPAFDRHRALMSLPLVFGTRLGTVPATVPYLRPDPGRVAAWQQRLGARQAPRVGLMWNGNPNNAGDRYRSFPLAKWLPYLPGGFEYYSLQRFVRADDRPALESGIVRDLSAEQTVFDDAAALCVCMDLVISVCTSIAHLSGALGRPTWVLLSRSADWRWLAGRGDSPWYPTVRLYRQSVRGEWSSLFERVATDLRASGPRADGGALT